MYKRQTKNNDKMGDMSGNGSAMTGEPKTAEEALALHKELLERENALLSENTELWEKVFMEADKGMAMITISIFTNVPENGPLPWEFYGGMFPSVIQKCWQRPM